MKKIGFLMFTLMLAFAAPAFAFDLSQIGLGSVIGWLQNNQWVGTVIAIALAVHTVLKAVFDALSAVRAELDQTPATDDNAFERFVTAFGRVMSFLGKVATYLVGIRQKK